MQIKAIQITDKTVEKLARQYGGAKTLKRSIGSYYVVNYTGAAPMYEILDKKEFQDAYQFVGKTIKEDDFTEAEML